jgi:hypothetical protein
MALTAESLPPVSTRLMLRAASIGVSGYMVVVIYTMQVKAEVKE